MHASAALEPATWRARLELGFERRGDATQLTRRRHEGPLRVQKALHPEGPGTCHAVILHPPAGIAGGDDLGVDVALGDAANALITTPGAGKWYRSAGPRARLESRCVLARAAALEWLPQESIIFDGARASFAQSFDLAPDARLIAWEITCFGRVASGERFLSGTIDLATRIRRGGRLIWREQAELPAGDMLFTSPVGLAAYPVTGVMLASGAPVSDDLLSILRALEPPEGLWGISRLPDLLVARCLGHHAELVRAWFVSLWQHLRPALVGLPAVAPRIWNT